SNFKFKILNFFGMSRRNKILIIVVLILVALALAYWLFLEPKLGGGVPETNVNVPLEPLALPPGSTTVSAVVPEASREEKLRSEISRLAAAFAERFGSYSNQGDFENLLDLKSLMTGNMQTWVDNFVAESKAGQTDNTVYFGVTTKSVSLETISIDEAAGEARIKVSAQRREASGTMSDNVRIYYQDLELGFKKVGGEWKVDEATWK
ncbi:MAG: hypothetical protein Q8K55_08790, partial [Gemmatimonadaceae bacterium]|nr:hypothetical protein [Gemmatimonadaceae bacterium]